MPLLDHFHSPLAPDHHWESFHSNWATRIADSLNELLPEGFYAEEFTYAGGRLEIDVATFEASDDGTDAGGGTATLSKVWTPPSPPLTIPAVFPDTFEIRVYRTDAGRALVGAIELVSPGNLDRIEERRAFVAKCAGYLHGGASVVIVDVVTSRRANLHRELLDQLANDVTTEADDAILYTAAYRPVERDESAEIDVWCEPLVVGEPLPTMPLRLVGDQFVPVELEETYAEACRRRRLPNG